VSNLRKIAIAQNRLFADKNPSPAWSQCVFSQRNAVLQLAQRSFPSRVVSSVNSIGNGPETNWDMSMFRSGTAILPRCIAIVTQVESETGEVVELNQCPSLPDIDNGMFVCSSSNVIGSICKTICDAGFVGTGYGDQNVSRTYF
jgi:hypothetical protein